MNALLTDFGKATQQTDPVIHFYETFLAEFDPKLRKSRGVWYTPEPVVNFIVRAVDDILKDEFGLKDGLADTSKTKVKVKVPTHDKRHKEGMVEEEREVHKVQILDPAAGTGTFLAEVIKQIHSKFEGQQGIWPDYVENHLIPRLNGFEILMASYAMAHLKLDLLLKETGYDRESDKRFRVYLTNSLEEHHPDTGTLFAGWLSNEANEANHIKRDTPVMVVLGNPPYSVSSSNKSEWIEELMQDYKKDLNERNIQPLSDDYVKFIRFGQHFIDKNGYGIMAYITNNSFVDGIIHRQMRKYLLNTFDKIYILNLHGSAKNKSSISKETKDQNVFDIMQGVSINLFIKNNKTETPSDKKVFYSEQFGTRIQKYEGLDSNSINDIKWKRLKLDTSNLFFSEKNFESAAVYTKGFSLDNFFTELSSGIAGGFDKLFMKNNYQECVKLLEDLREKNIELLIQKFNLNKGETKKLERAIQDIKSAKNISIQKIIYRVFDWKYAVYTGRSNGIMERPRSGIMKHFINKSNIGLIVNRQHVNNDYSHISVTKDISNKGTHYLGNKGNDYLCPLYLYPKRSSQVNLDGTPERKPNLNPKIVKKIADGLGLKFEPEKREEIPDLPKRSKEKARDDGTPGTFAPIDLLDYIYAVLHSPTYRETYKEFLKIDFPRVPYPDNPETFRKLVELGGELRQIHLLEHPIVNDFITTYPVAGSNKITKRLTKTDPGFIPYEKDHENHTTPDGHRYPGEKLGKVQINDQQYFGNVPLKAWGFYIGGYQPAEKWLKDRRDCTLSMEEIQHYQKIIVALMETARVMGEVDGVFEIQNNEEQML